jgi:hypothetical protein
VSGIEDARVWCVQKLGRTSLEEKEVLAVR